MNKSTSKILLIAGHHRAGIWPYPHRRDPGAIPHYPPHVKFDPPVYNEHHECEKLVIQAHDALKMNGYTVWVCPFKYDLYTKKNWANKVAGPDDLLVEVHLNSVTNPLATGSSVWYYSGSDASRSRASKMSKIISDTVGLKNRGAKGDMTNRHGQLYIIRETDPWAFLFEVGFISNPSDMQKVREFGAQAIIDAIQSNF